ncbi:retrovirus-related pol polyprotein from transposon RE2 [Tanacetum coccineum]
MAFRCRGASSESTFQKITPRLPKGMHDCEICHYSKSTRLPFNSSLSKTNQAFELIHSDVWGPFPSSLDGFKYFVTFIDDFSKVKQPKTSHLRVFGCICFVDLSANHRDKLDQRSVKCIFLGYSQTKKGYTCYDVVDGKLYVSRDVRFLERSPYFENSSKREIMTELFPLPNVEFSSPHSHNATQEHDHSSQNSIEQPPDNATQEHENSLQDSTATESSTNNSFPTTNDLQTEVPRRNPPRDRQPPAKMNDYVSYTAKYSIDDFLTYKKLSPSHTAFLTALSNVHDPKTFQEAQSQAIWRKAMQEELAALVENKTWSIVSLPKGKHAVGSRWVFKTKFNSDGSVDRHKAPYLYDNRQGFTQQYGVDYKETFAPVAKMTTRRKYSRSCPPGHPQKCVKTKRFGDSSLYVRLGKFEKLAVLIYVDDLIITGNNEDSIKHVKNDLQQRFPIKDLGPLKYFLGIELAASSKGIFLNQCKYVIDLLKDSNMLYFKPVATLLDSKLKLKSSGEPLRSASYYQKLVGKLIYLTITRFDNSFVACNSLDHRSTTGYCVFVGGNLVSWKSKKQHVVARSSAEAEYRAMATTSCEMVWLKRLIDDLGCTCSTPMTLFCDNQAAMHIAANPVFHERTKHIEVDCHYV